VQDQRISRWVDCKVAAQTGDPQPFTGLDAELLTRARLVLASTDSRVYITRDGGKQWDSGSRGLPRRPHCTDLRFSRLPAGSFAFLATYGRSVWASRLDAGPDEPLFPETRASSVPRSAQLRPTAITEADDVRKARALLEGTMPAGWRYVGPLHVPDQPVMEAYAGPVAEGRRGRDVFASGLTAAETLRNLAEAVQRNIG
jgi:hypothetical protein